MKTFYGENDKLILRDIKTDQTISGERYSVNEWQDSIFLKR